MSWLFSQALVEVFSEDTFSDGEQSAPLSGKPTQQAYCAPDKMTDFSRLSRYGMTFRPLTDIRGEELLTLYREVFHAKTLAQQEKAQESTESEAGCGEKWHASFARYDPDTSLWKTHQCSLLGDLDEFSETWPQWGLMRDGECWEQRTLEQTIRGTESGLSEKLPTIVKSDHAARRPSKGWAGTDLPSTLWKKNGGLENPNKPPLKLNARYAEWMMGWPQGWAKLAPLEMDKSHSVQLPPGGC
jgi:hypothetical protein